MSSYHSNINHSMNACLSVIRYWKGVLFLVIAGYILLLSSCVPMHDSPGPNSPGNVDMQGSRYSDEYYTCYYYVDDSYDKKKMGHYFSEAIQWMRDNMEPGFLTRKPYIAVVIFNLDDCKGDNDSFEAAHKSGVVFETTDIVNTLKPTRDIVSNCKIIDNTFTYDAQTNRCWLIVEAHQQQNRNND